MHLDALDQLAAGGAALAAGAVNALAGGGTLISFPSLIALGLPAVEANVTNTVSLLPGYLAGSWAQRADLEPQLAHARLLSLVAALGGLAGSVLLVVLPNQVFRAAVPYLILGSCALLGFGDRLRPGRSGNGRSAGAEGATPRHDAEQLHVTHRITFMLTIFIGAVYGGFFGAGLGIMLLALLGLFSDESLVRLNALKQALSFVVNLIAALFFVFSGRVVWLLVPVMAAGSLIGGFAGGRMVRLINPKLLRNVVVVAGVGVAIALWVA